MTSALQELEQSRSFGAVQERIRVALGKAQTRARRRRAALLAQGRRQNARLQRRHFAAHRALPLCGSLFGRGAARLVMWASKVAAGILTCSTVPALGRPRCREQWTR